MFKVDLKGYFNSNACVYIIRAQIVYIIKLEDSGVLVLVFLLKALVKDRLRQLPSKTANAFMHRVMSEIKGDSWIQLVSH